jgi:hypothetical protein
MSIRNCHPTSHTIGRAMKRLAIVFVAALSLAACVQSPQMKAAAMRDDDETCRAMGFKPDTAEYRQCRLATYQGRENRKAQIRAAALASTTTCVQGFGYGRNIVNCY